MPQTRGRSLSRFPTELQAPATQPPAERQPPVGRRTPTEHQPITESPSSREKILDITIAKLLANRVEIQNQIDKILLDLAELPDVFPEDFDPAKLEEQIAELEQQSSNIDKLIARTRSRLADGSPDRSSSVPSPRESDTSRHHSASAAEPAAADTDAETSADDAVPRATVNPTQAATLYARLFIPKDLPKFRNGTDSQNDAEEFMDGFERTLKRNGMSVDLHWARLLPDCLNKTDGRWLEDSVPQDADWKTARAAFMDKFEGSFVKERLIKKLVAMRRKPRESLDAFCERFDALTQRVGANDNEVVIISLLDHLPPHTRGQVKLASKTQALPERTVSAIVHFIRSMLDVDDAPLSNDATEPTKPTASSRDRPYCAYHRRPGHATEDCIARQRAEQKKKLAPGASTQSAENRERTPASQLRCYNCNRTGHTARDCRVPRSSGRRDEDLHVNLTSMSSGGPASPHGDKPFITEPVVINGVDKDAIVDGGSQGSVLTREFAEQLHLSITPISGMFRTAFPDLSIPRIGLTPPVHVLGNNSQAMHKFDITDTLAEGHSVLIGRDLMPLLNMHSFGMPGEKLLPKDPPEPSLESAVPSLADLDYTEAEKEPEFVAYRNTVLSAVQDELQKNAAIPADAFCPLPESVVHLNTPANEVVHKRQYPVAYKMIEPIDAVIRQWLEDGVIELAPVGTTFNTPIFAVPKKDAEGRKTLCRVCADFRALNALLPDDSHPLPLIKDIFSALAGSAVYTTLDIKTAFHRFLIAPEDRAKTCFTWQHTQYVFVRAPFGLKTLPSIFQRAIQLILSGLPFVRAYIDDVIVFSNNRADHASHVNQVVQRLTSNNLMLNVGKCHIARLQIALLGFVITPYGRAVDPHRVANVAEWPVPTHGKQLQHYLGFANYFREHIPRMSTLTAPLDALRNLQDLRPHWTAAHDESFARLKDMLAECPPLAHPDFEAPFYVGTDASAAGIGAVLYQLDPGSQRPRWISFQARALSKSERNYSATKRELLAIIFALQKFHHYIWGTRFTLRTDHAALTYLHTQPRLNPMLTGWYELIFEYDFAIVHCPGILNILPDHLSRFFAPNESELGGGEDAHAPQDRRIALTTVQTRDHAVRAKPLAVPGPDERERLLTEHHLYGHFGATAVARSIQEAGYSWPNIHQDALAHCQRCVSCLRYNSPPRAFHELKSITAALPLEHVAVDLAGPFPTSRKANHYLHVLIDVHSRFVLLKAIPDKRMETIAALWLDIFTTFGFPKIIQSDNGTEFVNHTVKKMLDLSKIDHRLVSSYHPRANGVAERAVQTATHAIKKLLKGVKQQWDVYVPFVQFCINQKISERHRLRPFSVMFGRQANGFANFTDEAVPAGFEPSDAEHEQVIATIRERVKLMHEQLFPEVADRNSFKADKDAKRFNKKHKMANIPIGTHVMVRDALRKAKLDPTNEGPYKVVGRTRGGSYILLDNDGQLIHRHFPPSAIISLSTNPTFAQESFEVEKILEHRETPDGMRYRVRWKNYPPEEDTWEPEENFDDQATIQKYWTHRAEQEQQPRKTTLRSGGNDVM